ncbi:MAG TPA: S8 family serine peptidase [Acidimicrobiia bacterium]|nr:S8 family serine peptidase [Acidimicrobiia bacterium]
MEPEPYVILKSPVDPQSGSPVRGRSFDTVGPASLHVETAEVTSNAELRDIHKDPETLAAAPRMPLILVEPSTRDADVTGDEEDTTWGVQAVKADISPFNGSGVTVAVLDTGIDADHPAFQGVDVEQKDFTGEGDGDDNGHGTHCAATIFGQDVDGLRIGVASGVSKALIGKVLGSGGGGSTEGIVQAVQWAINNGANVISLSLGIDFPGMVKRLIEIHGFPAELATTKALEAYRANINLFGSLATMAKAQSSALGTAALLVAAAGNESRRDVNPNHQIAVAPPAAAEGFYSVGALGKGVAGFEIAAFSNTGPNVSGPGVAVQSAKAGDTGLRPMSGTSMATPHVAGVAALWASRLLTTVGALDNTALSAQLVASGRQDKLSQGFDPFDVGTGMVQAPLS